MPPPAAFHRSAVPQDGKARVAYLLQNLLEASSPLSVFDLCEELYVSLSTFKSDVGKVRETCSPFHVKLIWENNHIRLEGLERNMRKLAGSLLRDEATVNFLDIDTIQRAFPDTDVDCIHACVRDSLDELRRFASDYSITNLVLHIAITVDRLRSHHALDCAADSPAHGNVDAPGTTNPAAALSDTHEDPRPAPDGNAGERSAVALEPSDRNLADMIAGRIERSLGVVFSPAERDELALLAAARTSELDYRTATRDNIVQFVGLECLGLVQEIIDDLQRYYGIDLSEDEFFVRFALHIKNLLMRARTHELSANPLTRQIQTTCPLLYDTAVAEARIIQKRCGITINDDEIAYIAFHLGSTIETQKQLTNKIRTVLYCPAYYDTDTKISLFLNRHFEDDLIVTNVITEEGDLRHISQPELIITTVPLNMSTTLPVATITMFPAQDDRDRLRATVIDIKRDKRRRALRANLEKLLTPELFISDAACSSRENTIHVMVKRLDQAACIDDEFEQHVLERERLSSTAFGTFAMPHPVRLCAQASGICVLIPSAPIPWGEAEVGLVIMLAFNRADRVIFYEVFDPLVSVLANTANVAALSRSKNYEEFISTLCSLMD